MLAQRLRSSFAMRVAALFLGLLALVQIASFTAISASLGAQARSTLPERLAAGERVLKSLLDQRAQTLAEAAKLLAADFGFRDAVLSEDSETIGSVLENHGSRIGATEAVWLGTDFSLRAAAGTGMDAAQFGPAAAALAGTATSAGSASGLMLVQGRPHQIVLVPMKAPVLVGWVAMGFPIDAQLGTDLQALAALNLTLLARGEGNAAWSVVQTTLDAAAARQLAAQTWGSMPSAMAEVRAGDEELGVRPRWLRNLGAGDAEGGPAVLALVSLSIDEAARTPQRLQLALLLITLLAVGIFAIGSLYTATRVTTPLRQLARAAEQLGGGDYDTPVRGAERSDELGELAQSFERMRVSVGEKQAQILKLAYWDALTGLPNRVQFGDAVEQAIAAASPARPLAVLMLDLDRFKNINAKLGYGVGDRLLQAAAERLQRQVLREGDLVARRSGDEFAVLLRDAMPELAASVAQRIARAFEQPLSLDDNRLDLTVGVGIACWPLHADAADTLINRAEMAMYAAKKRHAGPQMYEPAMDDSSAQSLSLLSDLREAVVRGELRLHLQPKLALATGAVAGAEALVRWQHPVRGMIPPGQFVPFAEQTGFIRQLTLWVFEACAKAWRELHAEGADMVLSVNLSARDLFDSDLPTKLEALLLQHRVPAEAFCLEITESAIMDDPERALATLKRLALMGFKLSIDDFGSGMSSYGYLKLLPVDELKIDMVFVRNMDRDPVDVKLVRSMIELAHNLGLAVVAEGVENAKVWDQLRELNCDQAQGYHMGKPMPIEEFVAWSARWVEKSRVPRTAGTAGLLH